jgi:hypothetical protein
MIDNLIVKSGLEIDAGQQGLNDIGRADAASFSAMKSQLQLARSGFREGIGSTGQPAHTYSPPIASDLGQGAVNPAAPLSGNRPLALSSPQQALGTAANSRSSAATVNENIINQGIAASSPPTRIALGAQYTGTNTRTHTVSQNPPNDEPQPGFASRQPPVDMSRSDARQLFYQLSPEQRQLLEDVFDQELEKRGLKAIVSRLADGTRSSEAITQMIADIRARFGITSPAGSPLGEVMKRLEDVIENYDPYEEQPTEPEIATPDHVTQQNQTDTTFASEKKKI